MNKISVLVKEPGEPAYRTHIENDLTTLQETVGGFIETMRLSEDCVLICNEEGRIWGLPFNVNVFEQDICGTIILAGVNGVEFGDLSIDTIKILKKLYPGVIEER